jgi:ankyrin repeat protein
VANPRLLVDAAQRGDLAVMRALLDAGADANGRVLGGATALHRAAHHGRLDVAELLLERGAAVDAREDVYHATPVSWANEFGQQALRDHLLDCTRDVFDLASWARVEQLEAVLRANPALASARRALGLTPLHRLEVSGERGAAIIDLLLRYGADVDARSDDGRTPLDACVAADLDEIANLLRERGAERG